MTAGSLEVGALPSHPDGVVLALVVARRSSKTEFDCVDQGAVRDRVAAPPVDDAANAALIRFLAEAFGLPKGSVQIVAGQSGRRKRVLLVGLALSPAVDGLAGGVGGARGGWSGPTSRPASLACSFL